MRFAWLFAALMPTALMVGACAHEATRPQVAKITCPYDLSAVKAKLVTPYPKLVEFIGQKEMDETLNEPVDQMISENGGIDAAISGTNQTIQEYKDILNDQASARHDFKIDGKTDAWIDTYMSAVKDGITINQAFVDAVECRKAQGGYVPEHTIKPGSASG